LKKREAANSKFFAHNINSLIAFIQPVNVETDFDETSRVGSWEVKRPENMFEKTVTKLWMQYTAYIP